MPGIRGSKAPGTETLSAPAFLPEVFGAAVGLGLLATPLWPGPGLALAVLGGMGVVLDRFVAERQEEHLGRCAEPRPGCCSGSH